MAKTNNDLFQIFQTVTSALNQNKQSLNQADTYNNDHGDNMVSTFETITSALKQKKNADQSEALAYAADVLKQNAKSGSAKLYAESLNQASHQVSGTKLNPQMGMQLLQTLLSGGQQVPQAQPTQAAPGGDLLGSLLGGLTGGSNQNANQQQPAGGDLLGSLLGGLTGGSNQNASQSQQQPDNGGLLGSLLGGLTGGQQSGGFSDGIDLGDLMTAGMVYMQSKGRGEDNMNALVDAFTAASGMGKQPYRQQSTQLVANSFMQALSGLAK
jgi:hypothetical protein